MLLDLLILYMFGSSVYVFGKLVSVFLHAVTKTEEPEPLTKSAAQPGAAPRAAASPAAAAPPQESAPATADSVEIVQNRVRMMSDSLRTSAAVLDDRELAKTLEQLAVTLELLGHNAQIDPRDIPATLRFLERYGAPLDKLVDTYVGMERAHGATPAMRKSMKQIKDMLLDFSRAYEQFRLSLFENDIMTAAVEMDVARSLLMKDGLGGSAFAATEIMEIGGE